MASEIIALVEATRSSNKPSAYVSKATVLLQSDCTIPTPLLKGIIALLTESLAGPFYRIKDFSRGNPLT